MKTSYELYTVAFGASPDEVFASQDKHPYVAGEFVWSGWDHYIGCSLFNQLIKKYRARKCCYSDG